MIRMSIIKFAFVLVGLVLVFGYQQKNVAADDEGTCQTSSNCSLSNGPNPVCYCAQANNCKGCFLPNNTSGCGTCSGDLELQ